jgi:flagellar hook-associated protein 2
LGSPITFSGFNSIDFNLILNSVMASERQPLTRLQSQKSTLETQNSQFATLAGKLSTLKSAVDTLKTKDSLAFLSATSSDAGVGVSADGGTITGTYDIAVTRLATAQVTASQTTFGALTDVIATSGTLTLADSDPGTADTVITFDGTTSTLEQLAAAINGEEDSPASASIVQTSPGVYTLVLTARETGEPGEFTVVANGLAGGIGLTMNAVNTQEAENASFTVNGLPVTSATNTAADVIEGVTLSLLKKDATATVRVERDETKAGDALKKFINAYNDILTFAKDQNTIATAGRASIGRDPLVRSLREALRSAATAAYGAGTFTKLAEIGVGFDRAGKMTLDSEVFEHAVATSPGDVQALVSGASGNGGAFAAFSTLVDDYTKAGGLVATARERIDDQVGSLATRLDTMESQLALRRAALQRQYMEADLAMTRLKAQSSSLSSVGGGYRLF